jgi:hypothetical protein
LLKLNGVDVVAGAEILLADLPNITFVPTANFNPPLSSGMDLMEQLMPQLMKM